jgi:hypothetical protein
MEAPLFSHKRLANLSCLNTRLIFCDEAIPVVGNRFSPWSGVLRNAKPVCQSGWPSALDLFEFSNEPKGMAGAASGGDQAGPSLWPFPLMREGDGDPTGSWG